jgi:hypothetical protein
MNFKNLRKIFSLRSKFTLLKGRAIIKGQAQDIGREFLKNTMKFDFFTVQSREFLKNDEGHIVITDDILDLPCSYLLRSFIPRRKRRTLTYWGIDDQGCFYVLKSTFNTSGGETPESTMEAFVCVPCTDKSDRCLIYFFSDFNYYSPDGVSK